MALAGIAARRLRHAPARSLAYALVVAVVAGLGVGLTVHLDSGLTRGVRAGLEQAVAVDSVRALSTRWASGEEGAAQRDLGDRLVARAVEPVGGRVRAEVRGSPREVRTPSGPRPVVLGDLGPTAGLRLTAGSWPTGPEGVAVRDDLDVAVGDRLVDGESTWTVEALWRPADPAAARWSLDPAYRPDVRAPEAAPESESRTGLVLVSRSALAADPQRPFLRWTVSAAPGLTADQTPRLAQALTGLEPRLGEEVAPSGLLAQGRLPQTLDRLDAVARAVAPLFPVALALVGVGCLLVLGQLARLQAASRVGELTLLRARGASLPQVAALAALEATATCLPLAGLGGGVGLAVARLLPDGDAAPVPWAAVASVIVGVLVLALLLAALALAAVAARALARTTGETTGRSAGSLPRVAALVLLGVVAVASVARLWQRADSGAPADAFLALAPASALLLPAVIVLIALGAVTGGIAVVAARSGRGLPGVLAARQVARRLPLVAAPAIALTLTVGSTLLASGYAATSAAGQEAALRAQVGPDVRVAPASGIASPPLSPAEAARVAEALGPEADTAAALTRSARIGEADDVSFLAVAARAVPGTPERRVARSGLPLPAAPPSASELTVELATRVEGASATPATVRVEIWLRGRDGAVRTARSAPASLPLTRPGARDASTPLRLEVPWPADLVADARVGALRLVALDVLFGSPVTASVPVRAEVRSLEVAGAAADLPSGWRALAFDGGATAALPAAAGFSGRLDPVPGGQLRRLLPPGVPEAGGALPVVADRALATTLAIRPGDTVDAVLEGSARPLPVRIDQVVPTLASAGAGPAVLADPGDLQTRLLQQVAAPPLPDELWAGLDGASADRTQAATERVRRVLSADVAVTTASPSVPARQIAPAAQALWAGAWGGGLLTVLAFVVAGLAALDVRRRELPVLHGLGVDARSQALGRLGEQAIVVLTALVAGALTGLVAALLVVQPLARTVVPDLPGVLGLAWRWDVATAALLLVGVLLGVLVATVAHALVVARQVRATLLRGSTL